MTGAANRWRGRVAAHNPIERGTYRCPALPFTCAHIISSHLESVKCETRNGHGRLEGRGSS